MKIIIDTNKIIAVLIKDIISRKIIFDANIEFITPEHTLSEINEHKQEILNKAGITEDELEILLELIFGNIEIIPLEDYKNSIEVSEIIRFFDEPCFRSKKVIFLPILNNYSEKFQLS